MLHDDDNSNRIDESTIETFLEQESRDGTERIKSLSIEERTKRAMLAEAVEDCLTRLYTKLEKLVGDDGKPLKDEYRDQIVELANLIKASENDYHLLVSGKESPMLNALDG